ncbi:MAG: NAD(P)H-dependent oxidoreductase, partial [Granulosicoccus sp.]
MRDSNDIDNMKTILHINSSARVAGSLSREVGLLLVERLLGKHPDARVTTRDASAEGEFLTEDWIGASFTPKEDRSAAQNQRLAVSNKLANEVLDADI